MTYGYIRISTYNNAGKDISDMPIYHDKDSAYSALLDELLTLLEEKNEYTF